MAEKEGFEVRCTPACGARKNSRALRRSIFSNAAPPACSLIPPPAALAINARAERRSGSNSFVITKIPPSIRTTALWRRRRDLKCGAPPLAVPEKILGLYAARFFRPLRRRLLADSATGGARNQRPRRAALGLKSLCYNKNAAVHTDDGIVAEKEGFEVRCTPACGARKNSPGFTPLDFFDRCAVDCSLIPPPAALAINARAERRSGSNPFVITKMPPSIRTTALWRRRRDLNPRAAIRDLHP